MRFRTSPTRVTGADAPGNVSLDDGEAGLAKTPVINVSQIVTIDKGRLGETIGRLTLTQLEALDNGLRLALDLAG